MEAYYVSWNPSQRRNPPPVSKMEEARRAHALSMVNAAFQGDQGIPHMIRKKRRI